MTDKQFPGEFVSSVEEIILRRKKVKALLFDWDGVFNNGQKNEKGASPFNEVDAMGTNLVRFNNFLLHEQVPYTAVITGEKNEAAFTLAKREHFDAVYFRVKHKVNAIEHICRRQGLSPHELAFVFDDVLDFSAAKEAGLRILVSRPSSPLLTAYAKEQGLVDYCTAHAGGNHGLREAIELIMGASGLYTETIDHRSRYSQEYKTYLGKRDEQGTLFFATDEMKPETV